MSYRKCTCGKENAQIDACACTDPTSVFYGSGASVSPPKATPAQGGHPGPSKDHIPGKDCVWSPCNECGHCTDIGDFPVRTFDTGATRDTDEHKLDYEAFLSPLALERYARYMDTHRRQKDGTVREGDNWQKGIPLEAYAKSEWRHHMEFWSLHRGYGDGDIEEAICAALFNLNGYLHELLKAKNG